MPDTIAIPTPKPFPHWNPMSNAPEDRSVILATSGGWTGQAILSQIGATGESIWIWSTATNEVIPVHLTDTPLGWIHLPDALYKPVE